MRSAILWQACLLIVLMFVAAPAEGKRIALVIGINSYSNLPDERQLKKAVNDARSIRDTLKADLGFDDIFYEENADRLRMKTLIRQAEANIERGDVAFVYFSGHGVSIGSGNYLLPSDVPKPVQGDEEHLIGNSFEAEDVAQRMLRRGAQAVFSVIDACRDNPFVDERGRAVGGGAGLTRIDQAQGVFSLFAAGLGQVALDRTSDDDPNPNSVFTRSLIPLLKTVGLTQVDLAKRVQQEVVSTAAAIGHKQMPVYNDGLLGFVTLKEPHEAPAEPPKLSSVAQEWRSVESGSKEALEAFQRKYRGDPLYGRLAAQKLQYLKDLEDFRNLMLVVEEGNKLKNDPATAANVDGALNGKAGPGPKEDRSAEDGGNAQTASQTQMASIDPAVDKQVQQCDMLASHPDDPDKPQAIAGILEDYSISDDAMGICEEAVRKRPDLRRLLYQSGRAYDSPETYETANAYYERAAAMGSKAAMVNLSLNYATGRGVEPNLEESIEWAKKALRPPDSFRNRGLILEHIGHDYRVGGDPKQARAWYAASVEEGGQGVARYLARLIDEGKGGLASSDIAASLLLLDYCRGDRYTRDYVLKKELHGWTKNVRTALQGTLKQKGFYSGKIDGVVGEGTFRALERAKTTMCPEIEEKFKAEGGVFASLREQGVVGEDPRKELQ